VSILPSEICPYGAKLTRFRVAASLLEEFENTQNVKQVEKLILELSQSEFTGKKPTDIYERIYAKNMRRIEQQSTRDKNLAFKMLMWLTYAGRLMTISELRCALAIEVGDNALDEHNVCSEDLLLQVCAGLVTVNAETGVVRLAHQTVKEYFERLNDPGSQSAHCELAITSLTYLCFDRFQATEEPETPHGDIGAPYPSEELASNSDSPSSLQHRKTPFDMTPSWLVHHWNGGMSALRLEEDRESGEVIGVMIGRSGIDAEDHGELGLLDYAANFWHIHAKHCETGVETIAMQLLTNHRLAANAFIHATSLHEPWPFLSIHRSGLSKATGLHLVAAVGLAGICSKMLTWLDDCNGSPNQATLQKRIELERSVSDMSVLWYVDEVNPDARDDAGRTPLMWAAHGGHDAVVRLLISRCDVEMLRTCARGETALHYACRRGHKTLVEVLNNSRDNKTGRYSNCGDEVRNFFGETPVVLAALAGHGDVIEAFPADQQKSLHLEVTQGLWPIHLAAQRRSAKVVHSLVHDFKVDPDVTDPKTNSALAIAADWDNLEVLHYFLREWDWHTARRSNQIFRAATIAASNRHRLRILQTILDEAGEVVQFCDQNGKTLLDYAVDAQNFEASLRLQNSTNGSDAVISDAQSYNNASASSGSASSRLTDYIRHDLSIGDDDAKAGFQGNFNPRCINYIMIYSGSFNPPHVGHLAFLQDSVTNSGSEMHVACAFINPSSDEILAEKGRGFSDEIESFYGPSGSLKSEDPLLLPREKRAQLWLSDERLPSWATVVIECHAHSSRASLLRLQQYAAEFGYTLQYAYLCSASWAMHDREYTRFKVVEGSASILINTFGRPGMSPNKQEFDLEKKPWQKLKDQNTDVDRFSNLEFNAHTDESSEYIQEQDVRITVRVIKHRKVHKSVASSTILKKLYCSRRSIDLPKCDILPELALSYELLRADPIILKWHTQQRQLRSAIVDGSPEDKGDPPVIEFSVSAITRQVKSFFTGKQKYFLSEADIDQLRKAWRHESQFLQSKGLAKATMTSVNTKGMQSGQQ
jgi:ankyrin repeat protein